MFLIFYFLSTLWFVTITTEGPQTSLTVGFETSLFEEVQHVSKYQILW